MRNAGWGARVDSIFREVLREPAFHPHVAILRAERERLEKAEREAAEARKRDEEARRAVESETRRKAEEEAKRRLVPSASNATW